MAKSKDPKLDVIAIQNDGIVTIPGRRVDELPPDVVRRLRAGEAVIAEVGIGAQVGQMREIWLRSKLFHVSHRGNVLLELMFPTRHVGTLNAQIDVDRDGTVTGVDFTVARCRMINQGHLRIDPVLALRDSDGKPLFGIEDPLSLEAMNEDQRLEAIEPLKSPLFWELVALCNATTYRKEYLASFANRTAGEVMQRLTRLEMDDVTGRKQVTQDVRKSLEAWIASIKEAQV